MVVQVYYRNLKIACDKPCLVYLDSIIQRLDSFSELKMSQLSHEDRLLIIQHYYSSGQSETKTVKEFVTQKKLKNHRDAPDRKTIREFVHKFETTFSLLDTPRSGRPSVSDKKSEEVMQSLLQHAGKSAAVV